MGCRTGLHHPASAVGAARQRTRYESSLTLGPDFDTDMCIPDAVPATADEAIQTVSESTSSSNPASSSAD